MGKKKKGPSVLTLYPDALTATCLVPPIHFNHVPYLRRQVAGHPVLVFKPLNNCARYPLLQQAVSSSCRSVSRSKEAVSPGADCCETGELVSCSGEVATPDVDLCETGELVSNYEKALSSDADLCEAGELVSRSEGTANPGADFGETGDVVSLPNEAASDKSNSCDDGVNQGADLPKTGEIVDSPDEILNTCRESLSQCVYSSESDEVVPHSGEAVNHAGEEACQGVQFSRTNKELADSNEGGSHVSESANEVVSEVVDHSDEVLNQTDEVENHSGERVSETVEAVSGEPVSGCDQVVNRTLSGVSKSGETVSPNGDTVSRCCEAVSEFSNVGEVVNEVGEVMSKICAEESINGYETVSDTAEVASDADELVTLSVEVVSLNESVASDASEATSDTCEVVSDTGEMVSVSVVDSLGEGLSTSECGQETVRPASPSLTQPPGSLGNQTSPDSSSSPSRSKRCKKTPRKSGAVKASPPPTSVCTDSPTPSSSTEDLKSITPNSSTQNLEATSTHHSSASDTKTTPPPSSSHDPQDTPAYSLWTLPKARDDNWKPVIVQSNDIQEDFAQNHLLINLQELGKHRSEVMFVLSQFSFDDYFKNARNKTTNKPRRPADLDVSFRRGDFDLLIIHRHFGILIGEIKSVGWNQDIPRSQEEAEGDIVGKVDRAVKQLTKGEAVIRYVLGDIAAGLTVRKVLFLPYVSTKELQQVLSTQPQLLEDMSQAQEEPNKRKVPLLCCCSDHLSDPLKYWDVNDAILGQLTSWWKRVWRDYQVDTLLNDQLYLDIVGRFVGTSSAVSIHCVVPPRIEVRTHGEAVSELGERLARLVLTQHQMDLLDNPTSRVCVTGPPGTGKTIVLILKGLSWQQQGHVVHVISTRPASLASSHVMWYQLQVTAKAYVPATEGSPGSVTFHQFDFYRESEVDRAVDNLVAGASSDGRLFILMEEAVFNDGGSVLGPRYLRFIGDLMTRVDDLYLWVARVRNDNIPPFLHPVPLTTPLRSAPVVLREVQRGVSQYNIYDYSSEVGVVPCPGDGPSVMTLKHEGQAHEGSWPHECRQCGLDVALLLKRLRVGDKAKDKVTRNSPDPLRYSDVFILTRTSDLQDDVRDDVGNVTSEASGIVRGLRQGGVPVCVLANSPGKDEESVRRWNGDVMETAVMGRERVTVAHWRPVLGLERKVVVWLRGRGEKEDRARTEEEVKAWDRVWIVSRCTTQLVLVDIP